MKKSNSASGLTALAVLQRSVLTALAVILALPIYSWDYDATASTTETVIQARVGANFTKKWYCGVRLSLSEELRFNLDQIVIASNAKSLDANSNKSYTTLTVAYAHPEFPYLKIDGGYTLRMLFNKGWSDPNEYLRHRAFFGLTGSYRIRYFKLSMRERFVCDMRTDSVNLLEKNRYNWLLRSRIGGEYTVPGKPVKPYLWAELENTLNLPEYQQKDGRQLISHVRAQAGVKWRITKLSSLDFFYRYQYGYNRDINITKGKGYIQLTEQKTHLHALGVAYNLDW